MRTSLSLIFLLFCGPLFSQFFFPMEMPKETVRFPSQPHLVWKYQTRGPIVASPVISDSLVFIGSLDSSLYALDLNRGTLKWKIPTNGSIRNSVCLIPSRLFLLSTDGILYRMTSDSGRIDGFFQTMTGYMGDHQADYADYFTSTPVIMDSIIYFGSGRYFYAMSINDGYLKWTHKTDGLVHSTPAFSKNSVYVGSFDGYVYALDQQTGNTVWKFKSTGRYSFPMGEVAGSPLVAAGNVYISSRDNNLYALDTKGGYANWIKQFPGGWGLPLTWNDSVLLVGTAEDQTLFALNPLSGKEIWKSEAGFSIYGGCALAADIGIFGTLAGKVMGIDLKTGKTAWTLELDSYRENQALYFKKDGVFRDDLGKIIKNPNDLFTMYKKLGGVFGKPALAGRYLVVAGYDGWIYCFTNEGEPEKKK